MFYDDKISNKNVFFLIAEEELFFKEIQKIIKKCLPQGKLTSMFSPTLGELTNKSVPGVGD